jgi:hypothetical protein
MMIPCVLAGLVLGGAGCTTTTPVKEKQIPDPLLTSKKPVEGRSRAAEERPVDRDDLQPPPPPPGAGLSGPGGGDVSVVQMLGERPTQP